MTTTEEPADRPGSTAVRDLAAGLHVLLQGAGATVATAESLTGGLVAEVLTDAPGASRSYRGGVVAYATEVKVAVLGVPQRVVDEHGVVSGPCARAMAEGALRLTGATYAVSTTGVAGPDEQEGKPVGRVHVAVAGPAGTVDDELDLDGGRDEVRNAACAAALSALSAMLAE